MTTTSDNNSDEIHVIDIQGGTEADVKARIGKARVAFLQLKNIWKCKVLSLKKKT